MTPEGSGWRRVFRLTAAGAVTVVAAAGIGLSAGSAGAATGPSWSRVGPSTRGGEMTAVTSVQWGSGNTSKWAFNSTASQTGNKGYPSVWSQTNTAGWAYQTLPGSDPGETFVAATAISNKDVLAFSSVPSGTGREWQFNGSTWRVIKTFDAPIGGADATSPTDVWVYGATAASRQLGVWHYDGEEWTQVASTLHGGDGLSAANAWAYTGSTVAHWNGKTWIGTNLASLIPGYSPRIDDVYDSDGTVYAVADSTTNGMDVLQYNGTRWSRVGQMIDLAPTSMNQVSPDGDGGIWFPASMAGQAGTSEIVHYTRSTKTLAETDFDSVIVSIARVGRTFELAGGSGSSGKTSPSQYAELEYYN